MTKGSAVFSFLALTALGLAAGCEGSNGGFAGVPVAASPTVAPSDVISLSNTGSTTAQVGAGTIDANISFPEVSSTAASITVNASQSLPKGIAPLLRTRAQVSAAATFVAYISLTSTAPFTLPSTPRFTFVFPTPEPGATATPDVQYFIAYLAPKSSDWVEPSLGPATVTFETVAFPVVVQPIPIASAQTYSWALYSLPGTPP
jgi:hypothetical protein